MQKKQYSYLYFRLSSTFKMQNPITKLSFRSIICVLASLWDNWTMISLVSFKLQSISNLYCGFCKKVSLWFRHPPALLVFMPSPLIQHPNCWASFQVLENENTDVLINLQMDNSVKLDKKSSNGIQNSPSSLTVSPNFSFSLSGISNHSGVLPKNYKNALFLQTWIHNSVFKIWVSVPIWVPKLGIPVEYPNWDWVPILDTQMHPLYLESMRGNEEVE